MLPSNSSPRPAIVTYRNGELLRRVRRTHRLTGVAAGVLALLGGTVVLLNLEYWPGSRQFATLAVLSPVMAVLCPLLLLGAFTPAYARVVAPGGVAWRLRPNGVWISCPQGDVRVPWDRARIELVMVRGHPVVRIAGDGLETAYPEEFLSHDHAQILFIAGKYSPGHRH